MNYYYDLKIPARLFFEIADSGNLELLVIKYKHKKEVLKKAWSKIYDLYFEKRDDKRMSMVLDYKKRIVLLKYKIDIINNCLKALVIVELPKEQLTAICEALKKLKIHIDPSKKITQEVLNALELDVNNLNIELDALLLKVKNMTSDIKSDFESDLVSIENTLERSISEDISLAKFIALERSASARSKSLKAMQNKRSRKR